MVLWARSRSCRIVPHIARDDVEVLKEGDGACEVVPRGAPTQLLGRRGGSEGRGLCIRTDQRLAARTGVCAPGSGIRVVGEGEGEFRSGSTAARGWGGIAGDEVANRKHDTERRDDDACRPIAFRQARHDDAGDGHQQTHGDDQNRGGVHGLLWNAGVPYALGFNCGEF